MRNINGDLDGKKLLMLAPCLGKFGGIEAFCLTLTEDLLKRGAKVWLLRKKVNGFSEDGSIHRSESEIRSTWSKEQSNRFISSFVQPRDRLIKERIKNSDLVHLHNPMVEGMWFAKKFSKPCVMTIYNWRRKGLHPRLWAWKWAVSNADRKWYISEFVWNSWEYKRKWNSARLPVISRMPKEECEPHKRKGFLYVGRWIPNKGIRILIEAYRLSSPNPSEWPLTMLGDGPLKAEVEERIRQMGIQGIHMPGFVSEKDRCRFTREAKWMVTPPHTKEDLGLTPLEARSVGVPCIASRDGGVEETAGKHSLLCKPGDIESLSECLKQAMQMSPLEYERTSRLAKEGLSDYVRPLDEYSEHYLRLLENEE